MTNKPFSFFLILACFSCGHEASDNPVLTSQSEVNALFPNFPDQPFLDLNFQDDYMIVDQKLNLAGYQQGQDEFSYISQDEKVKIILPESDYLADFKLLFFDKKETFYNDLLDLLSKKDPKLTKREDFSIYNFEQEKVSYKITLFSFENLIRLHFIPKSWH